jgi:hypothetical protein
MAGQRTSGRGIFSALVTTVLVGVARSHAQTAQPIAPQPIAPQPIAPQPIAQQPITQQAITQWPARLETPSGLLTLYQPQPDKFDGNLLTARAAVSLTPTGQTEPQFGAIWFHARVSADRDTHQVTIQDIEVKQVKLPNATPEQDKQFGDVIQQQAPAMHLVMSLDQLEATLSVSQKAKEESLQLQNNPPKIIFTQVPTTLIVLDGQPKMQESGIAGVMTVVNTPFIMLFDLNSKTYFLKAGSAWVSATDLLGSWGLANVIPQSVADVGAKLSAQTQPAPGQPAPSQPAQGQPAPGQAQPPTPEPQNLVPTATNIVVSEVPAELISSSGPPTYVPLPPGDLLYMSNTESDVFMEVATQHVFVLLSGRWFTASSLQGPWTFVASDHLPAAFAKIPADSPKANVLVCVAGTQQAKDARYDAYIPQTTAIQRNSGASLTVTYDGDPKFVPIQGTQMTYAQNSPVPVIDVDNQYYCCSQAVWYQSPSPTGPWTVCIAVPPAIYTIPPSCPIYNCRYCYVYDSTPDMVYTGYLPGYTGSYVDGPTVVYGTGYDYPYWYGSQFYAPPYTWGFGAAYDYYAGTWGFGDGFYYNRAWFASRQYNSRWFGPQGYVGYRDLEEIHARGGFANIRPEEHNVTYDRINIYNRQANLKRNAAPVVSRTAEISAAHESGRQVHPEAARTYAPAENNVYVGHDGAVYRRTQTGWETRDAKGWTPMTNVPEAQRQAEAHGETAHVEQAHVEQAHAEQSHEERQTVEQPHAEQTHAEPSRVEQTPIQNPARESPARENQVQQQPSHSEQPGGLEQDYAARERGSVQHSPVNGGGGGGAAVQHAPVNPGGGGEHGGGSNHH